MFRMFSVKTQCTIRGTILFGRSAHHSDSHVHNDNKLQHTLAHSPNTQLRCHTHIHITGELEIKLLYFEWLSAFNSLAVLWGVN